jgi:hypothetical protein
MTDITAIPTAEPELVEVPERRFLAVDGRGAPSGHGFETALGALLRAGAAGPVEGLWWTSTDTELDFADPQGWSWMLLLAVPGRRRGAVAARVAAPDRRGDVRAGAAHRAARGRGAARHRDARPSASVPARSGRPSGGVAPRGRARAHDLPAGPVLSTSHVGLYDELALAYTALLTAGHERGHEPRDPVIETYLTDPARVSPGEYVTRLEVPISP